MKHSTSELCKKAAIVGKKNDSASGPMIDFYVSIPKINFYSYAFSHKYSTSVYNMCKGGIQLERLLTERTANKAVMRIVKQAKRMIPYLLEYEWELAA